MTDSQSTSVSWNKAPTWGLRPDIYNCQTVAGLLMWGSFSLTCEEVCRLQLLLVLASTVILGSRVPFTVPDSRLPFRRLLRLAGLRWKYSTPPPLCKDRTDNIVPSNSPVVAHVSVAAETWVPSSGRLVWLHCSGLQAPCHSMHSITILGPWHKFVLLPLNARDLLKTYNIYYSDKYVVSYDPVSGKRK
jgi:hypothetical protein